MLILNPQNRKDEIINAIYQILETTGASKELTTLKVAEKVGFTEAALYRYYPSKTKMFRAFIRYIDEFITYNIDLAKSEESDTRVDYLRKNILLLLDIAEQYHGVARIISSQVAVLEDVALQSDINEFWDKLERKLFIAISSMPPSGAVKTIEAHVLTAYVRCFLEGQYARFVRSNFKYSPVACFRDNWALIESSLI